MSKKTKKITVINTKDFDEKHIRFPKSVSAGSISISYKRNPLYLHTEMVECPHGVDKKEKYGMIRVTPARSFADVLEKLDIAAKKIGAVHSEKLFGIKLEEDKIPYYPLLNKTDSVDIEEYYFNMIFGYKEGIPTGVTFWDRDSDKMKDPSNEINSRFSGKFLIKVVGLKINRDKLMWDYNLIQCKVLESSRLPSGCLIYDTEEEFIKEIRSRDATVYYEEEGIAGDLETNELVD